MPVQIKPNRTYDTGCSNKRLILDNQSFIDMCGFLANRPLIFDFETSGLDWFKHACACGVGLGSWDDSGVLQSFYVPFRHVTGEEQLHISVVSPWLKPLLENSNTLKIAHNIKFDEHIARREGIHVQGPRYDTMIAARLYDENRAATLKSRAVEDLGYRDAIKYENHINDEVYKLAKSHKMPVKEYRNTFGYSQINITLCGTYCCFDIDYTGQLYKYYERYNISSAYKRVWDTEMYLTEVLCDMEERGLLTDVDYLRTLRMALGGVLVSLEESVKHQLGGYEFNLASDNELREMLLKKLGVRLTKLTKKRQYAVDKEVLGQFVDRHPVLRQVIDWKEADKLYTTYTQSILDRLDAENIVHTDFQQVGTPTGRLSCRNPNLQNQSADSNDRAIKHSGKSLEDGGVDPWSVRRAYVNRGPGWVRLFFDYSQIELRVLAFYSRDPVMVEAYLKGEDIHTRTSLEVFGTKEKAKRRLAKVINFGLCIAEGQRVLTKQDGLVPIEQVQCWHLVWDGVEWVEHGGLVCRGECEVITYDGLTATPDHVVYLEDGTSVQIKKLASEVHSRRIAIGAIGEVPIRYSSINGGSKVSGKASISSNGMSSMLRETVGVRRQHKRETHYRLFVPKREIQRSKGYKLRAALRRYGSKVQSGYSRIIASIQRTWDQSTIQVTRTFCPVGFNYLPRYRLQGFGFRPDRQQRTLQFKKSKVSRSVNQPIKQITRVYDLVNAGPRHRFTVEGKVVSNSYGMAEKGFAAQTGITVADATIYLARFFERYKGVAEFRHKFWDEVRSNGGFFQNIFGRPRRIGDMESGDLYLKARAERKAIATLIQGTAAELTKESLVRVSQYLKQESVPAYLVSTVHDEIQLDCKVEVMSQVCRKVKELMEDFPMFHPIPIVVDAEYTTTSWADKQKVSL